MKITTFKLLQVTIILCVLFLSAIARLTFKNKNKNRSSKHKSKKFYRLSTSNPIGTTNNKDKKSQKPKEDPLIIAKRNCVSSCDNQLKESIKEVRLENEIPIRNESNLYVKRKDEDTEYYLCECLLSNNSHVVQKEFFFANKNNVELFLKGDDDGRKIYKKTLKKGLSESDNAIFKIVN